jgi:hypothetical protein
METLTKEIPLKRRRTMRRRLLVSELASLWMKVMTKTRIWIQKKSAEDGASTRRGREVNSTRILSIVNRAKPLRLGHLAEADALDEDDLELITENTGGRRAASSTADRDLKRLKRRGSSEDELPTLKDMFNDRTASRGERIYDGEEDDMDDFIEEDEEEEMDDEARAELRRQKKEAKRANSKKIRINSGADQQ